MLVYDFQFRFDECKRTFCHAFNGEEGCVSRQNVAAAIVYMAAGLAGASVEALSHTCWGPGRNCGSGVMDDIIVGSLPASS